MIYRPRKGKGGVNDGLGPWLSKNLRSKDKK
jgi:hypothetical protein